MKFSESVLGFFFPRRCPLCRNILRHDEYICQKCADSQIRISADFCHHCGYDKENCICEKNEISLSHITAPYIYSGITKAYIHRFKFRADKRLGKSLADELSFRAAECFFDAHFDCVTFVPLSKDDQKERGFNQSEILAKGIAKRLFIPCEELIEKRKKTRKQHEITAQERKENLVGAFSIKDGKSPKGKTVLLCDDVKTTGATLKACEKLLMENGAADVYCICIALSDYGDIFRTT